VTQDAHQKVQLKTVHMFVPTAVIRLPRTPELHLIITPIPVTFPPALGSNYSHGIDKSVKPALKFTSIQYFIGSLSRDADQKKKKKKKTKMGGGGERGGGGGAVKAHSSHFRP